MIALLSIGVHIVLHVMPNFFHRFNPRHTHGSCTALDRAQAATCEFYAPGPNGWCAHTIKDYVHEFEAPGPYGRPIKKARIIKDMVTGECFSADAAQKGTT